MTKSRFYRPFHYAAKHQLARFILVGIINTVIDFGVLLSLVVFAHISVLVANIISTSIALAVSYLLNKRAVFRDTNMHNVRQISLFLLVTLSGLWLVQGFVIGAISNLLWAVTSVDGVFALVIAKLVATAVTVMWNYILYSRVVFKDK